MHRFLFWMLCAAFTTVPVAASAQSAAHPPSALQRFGEVYRPVSAPAPDRAQVVYYRPGTPSEQGPAEATEVFVDGKLHAALLPGGYTVFCVAPGPRLLGSHGNTNAPAHVDRQQYRMDFKAGETYFLLVNDAAGHAGGMMVMTEASAQPELADNRAQTYLRSRAAPAMIDCVAGTGPKASALAP